MAVVVGGGVVAVWAWWCGCGDGVGVVGRCAGGGGALALALAPTAGRVEVAAPVRRRSSPCLVFALSLGPRLARLRRTGSRSLPGWLALGVWVRARACHAGAGCTPVVWEVAVAW